MKCFRFDDDGDDDNDHDDDKTEDNDSNDANDDNDNDYNGDDDGGCWQVVKMELLMPDTQIVQAQRIGDFTATSSLSF